MERRDYLFPGIDTFNLTNEVDYSESLSDPFYTYRRMAGTLAPGKHIAVDLDLRKYKWRIMNVSFANVSTSKPNITTGDRRESLPKNGTWTETSDTNPHVRFPELDLQVPYMHYYIQKCLV